MKKVTIEGKEYEVPDNAEYVAMDEDSRWWWYDERPEKVEDFWDPHGSYGYITTSTNWESTLRKI